MQNAEEVIHGLSSRHDDKHGCRGVEGCPPWLDNAGHKTVGSTPQRQALSYLYEANHGGYTDTTLLDLCSGQNSDHRLQVEQRTAGMGSRVKCQHYSSGGTRCS